MNALRTLHARNKPKPKATAGFWYGKEDQRVPMEHVIAMIEEAGEQELFFMRDLYVQVRNDPEWSDLDREMLWWLNHTLTLMVYHGLLRRHHIPTGKLGYSATGAWAGRDEVIGCFKAPRPKSRRARDRVRQQIKERNRQERARRRQANLAAARPLSHADVERRPQRWDLLESTPARRAMSAMSSDDRG